MDIEHLSAVLAQLATIIAFLGELMRWIKNRLIDKRERMEQESRKK